VTKKLEMAVRKTTETPWKSVRAREQQHSNLHSVLQLDTSKSWRQLVPLNEQTTRKKSKRKIERRKSGKRQKKTPDRCLRAAPACERKEKEIEKQNKKKTLSSS
jgi:hypothetical protein